MILLKAEMWSLSFYKTFSFCENLHLNCKSCFLQYFFFVQVLNLSLNILQIPWSGKKHQLFLNITLRSSAGEESSLLALEPF